MGLRIVGGYGDWPDLSPWEVVSDDGECRRYGYRGCEMDVERVPSERVGTAYHLEPVGERLDDMLCRVAGYEYMLLDYRASSVIETMKELAHDLDEAETLNPRERVEKCLVPDDRSDSVVAALHEVFGLPVKFDEDYDITDVTLGDRFEKRYRRLSADGLDVDRIRASDDRIMSAAVGDGWRDIDPGALTGEDAVGLCEALSSSGLDAAAAVICRVVDSVPAEAVLGHVERFPVACSDTDAMIGRCNAAGLLCGDEQYYHRELLDALSGYARHLSGGLVESSFFRSVRRICASDRMLCEAAIAGYRAIFPASGRRGEMR